MPKSTPLLRALRKELGATTRHVAAVAGLSEGALRNVEGGSKPADEHRFHRLAQFYSQRLNRPIAADSLMQATTRSRVGQVAR